MSPALDPALDLRIDRLIHAAPSSIWRAWTDPDLLARWWVPAPAIARVDVLDVRPGGGFVTQMSASGQEFSPHTDGIFVVAQEHRRLVFTNAITSGWRPARPAPVLMTAEIILDEHPDGTAYQAVVRHGDPAAKVTHEELGFFDGWGSVTAALAELVESGGAA